MGVKALSELKDEHNVVVFCLFCFVCLLLLLFLFVFFCCCFFFFFFFGGGGGGGGALHATKFLIH